MQAPARITIAEAGRFREQALAACVAGERDFDLATLVDYDSAAIAALLGIRRAPGGESARFLNVPSNLRKLALLYGVESLLFESQVTTAGHDGG